MSNILNIDTSANAGSVSISCDGMVLGSILNSNQSEHASFLQPAIRQLCKDLKISMNNIDAVSIANGPGSYTGLRIGLASAKGICFALKLPLIAINSLLVMSAAMIDGKDFDVHADLLCPMIDARRMEVFMAIFDKDLKEIISPCAKLIDDRSFSDILTREKIAFFGSGSAKIKGLINSHNAIFLTEENTINAQAKLADTKFTVKDFADVAYCEPYYLKEFFNG